MEELTLEKFEEASEIVKEVTLETKLIYSEYFSNVSSSMVVFLLKLIIMYNYNTLSH